MDHPARTAGEAVLATGAVLYPWWVQYLESGLHWMTGVGGVIALVLLIRGRHIENRIKLAQLRRIEGAGR